MTTLYTYRAPALMTLSETIAACAPRLAEEQKLLALLYSPACCRFAVINYNGETIVADKREGEIKPRALNQAADDNETYDDGFHLASIFEARLFNRRAEVRWLHTRGGRGEAAAIAESVALKLFGIDDPNEQESLMTINQTYLLWGAGSGNAAEEWSEMTTARTGAFLVPVPHLARQRRVQFNSVEYVKSYRDGNLGVFEERVTGLTRCDTRSAAGA